MPDFVEEGGISVTARDGYVFVEIKTPERMVSIGLEPESAYVHAQRTTISAMKAEEQRDS